MVPGNYKIAPLFLPHTVSAGETTCSGYVDTRGYDYLCIDLCETASTVTQLTGLRVRENDTVPTAFTAMEAIASLCGGTATSATAGFVRPTPNSVVTNVYHFGVDLKGRKRYVGIDLVPAISGLVYCNALLLRGEEGANQSVSTDGTATTTADSLRLDVKV